MQSAIWRICFLECVRGLRGLGLMCSSSTALTGRMRAGEDGLWRLPVCSRPSDRRHCWTGFVFDRMGWLLLYSDLARKKIWRDLAMDFYEAPDCRNLTHRASRPHLALPGKGLHHAPPSPLATRHHKI